MRESFQEFMLQILVDFPMKLIEESVKQSLVKFLHNIPREIIIKLFYAILREMLDRILLEIIRSIFEETLKWRSWKNSLKSCCDNCRRNARCWKHSWGNSPRNFLGNLCCSFWLITRELRDGILDRI